MRFERLQSVLFRLMMALVRDSMPALMRPHRFAPILVGIVALAIYAMTVAPDLTWSKNGGDGGELMTAAVTLGVPHPPGYPLYVLIGKTFASALPFGTVAFRLNLLSAVLMSIASGFLTAALVNLMPPDTKSPPLRAALPYLAAGLSFALAPLVWSQAQVAEVYPLSLALLAALLWALTGKRTSGMPFLIGVLLGAAVAAHLTALLVLPMTVGLVSRRRWHRLALGWLVGLTPFLLLPVLSLSDSPVNWGEARTLDGWWWLVSARLYQPNVFALPVSEWAARLEDWTSTLVLPFVVLVLPLTLLGARICWARSRRFALLTVSTAVIFLGYAFLYRTADAVVYLLPAVLLIGLMVGCALTRAGWPAVLLPLALLALNLSGQEIHRASFVRESAYGLLDRAEREAVVITEGEPTIFALWYFQHVEGARPDLVLVDADLFQFDWYRQQIGSSYPELVGLERDDLSQFASQNATLRPVCRTSLVPPAQIACSDDPEPQRNEF